ncbi:MAG TPA: diacylglycerol kinase family protein [Planctomycetaceae bacterium]|nr:diacylglycerol kinase family protein [Planctomycetaceae bacterium]
MLIIWNDHAGRAEACADLRDELGSRPGVSVRNTTSRDEALHVAAESARTHGGLIVAAGGDGTINAVISGLMQRPDNVQLGLIPLGTGNDLCRTLGIPLDPYDAAALLEKPVLRPLDVVRSRTDSGENHFINMAIGGNSALVMDHLTEDMKQRWGPLVYLRGTVDVLSSLVTYNTRLRFDDGPEEVVPALNVIIGNGRTAGGGLYAAPHANPEDGLLDVVVVLDGSPIDLAVLAAKFVVSDYVQSDLVVFRRARRVSVVSKPPLRFSADGDWITDLPVSFENIPAVLPVVVGPDYTPDPEGLPSIT